MNPNHQIQHQHERHDLRVIDQPKLNGRPAYESSYKRLRIEYQTGSNRDRKHLWPAMKWYEQKLFGYVKTQKPNGFKKQAQHRPTQRVVKGQAELTETLKHKLRALMNNLPTRAAVARAIGYKSYLANDIFQQETVSEKIAEGIEKAFEQLKPTTP